MRLIKSIAKKIKQKLEKLNLLPEINPFDFIEQNKGRKHRYSSICYDKKGKRVLFCARIEDNAIAKEKMFTEIKIAELTRKKKISLFPVYYFWGIEKDYEWFIRKYLEGKNLEKKEDIEKLNVPLQKKEIDQICRFLISLQRLQIKNFPFLKKRGFLSFFALLQKMKEIGVLAKKEKEEIELCFQKNKKILEKENNFFCHGDFHIGNMILTPTGIKIVDWESAFLSNFLFDAAFFWTRLWREKKIRRFFLRRFFSFLSSRKKGVFVFLFPLMVIFLSMECFFIEPKEYSKKMIEKRKDYFLTLIKVSKEGVKNLFKF